MPTYHSKMGVWYPAKERVALKNNSKQVIKNPSTDTNLKDEEINQEKILFIQVLTEQRYTRCGKTRPSI